MNAWAVAVGKMDLAASSDFGNGFENIAFQSVERGTDVCGTPTMLVLAASFTALAPSSDEGDDGTGCGAVFSSRWSTFSCF
jgi:hypothetical protein